LINYRTTNQSPGISFNIEDLIVSLVIDQMMKTEMSGDAILPGDVADL
jgi:hypothetical protein